MKKATILVLAVAFAFGISACKKKPAKGEGDKAKAGMAEEMKPADMKGGHDCGGDCMGDCGGHKHMKAAHDCGGDCMGDCGGHKHAGHTHAAMDAPAAQVEVPAAGKAYKPPLKKSQFKAGTWICDMGTVHYARGEKGDGVCPLCKMKLKQL
ncbi:MAG: hypothetical protein ABI333_20165 [bacterium]